MEQSGGDQSHSPENDQPASINVLFHDYGNLAVLRGDIDDDPQDPSLAPDNDGTINNEGVRKRPFTLSLNYRQTPETLKEKGYDSIKIYYGPSVILEGEPTKEKVIVTFEESVGTTKEITFRREESGKIKAGVEHRLDIEPENSPMSRLTFEQKAEITNDLMAGSETFLNMEGPFGEFARAAHFTMSNSETDLTKEDISLLQTALPALQEATKR